MKLKQRPEDFVVRESYRFEPERAGEYYVYRMDKQKLSTLQAIEKLRGIGLRRQDISVCGLKDKQGRTEQLVAVRGAEMSLQLPDLKLTLLGRSSKPLSADNIASNRFAVTVRDLSDEEAERAQESVREVERAGVINYFDSQRFGFLKHQHEIPGRLLVKGDLEGALKLYLATPSDLDRTDDAKVKRYWSEHWHEWGARCPYGEAMKRYTPIFRYLRANPRDYAGALMQIDERTRLMMIYELQSLLWNESAKRYLHAKVSVSEIISIRYQAGGLDFPRIVAPLRETFPLLAPDTDLTDPEVRAPCLAALAREHLRPERLVVPGLPRLFFKSADRPLVIHPGALTISQIRRDDMNTGRKMVHLAFTLPPGAYATLVVRRVMWFAEEARAYKLGAREEAANTAPLPARIEPPAVTQPPPPDPRTTGFRGRAKAKKVARAAARGTAKRGS